MFHYLIGLWSKPYGQWTMIDSLALLVVYLVVALIFWGIWKIKEK